MSRSMIVESISRRDFNMLSRALTEAEKSDVKHKHGCVITKGGRVLAVGHNRYRNSHPTMEIPAGNYTVHAEIDAASQVQWHNLKGCTVYIGRLSKSKEAANSAPCKGCLDYLEQAGVKRIVVT